MMNIGDFLRSRRWKLIQNYIYSWGASVVLLGALFKLEHLPFSGIMLGVGMSIEAIIFFVSAFEPVLEIPDWRVIYPQFRTGEETERDIEKYKKADEEFGNFFGGGGRDRGIDSFPPGQFDDLKGSLEKLSAAAKGLKNISDATAVTDNFVKNLSDVSESIGSVADANRKASSEMEQGVHEVTLSYKSVAKQMEQSSGKVAAGVEKTIEDLASVFTSTADGLKQSAQNANSGIERSIADLTSSFENTSKELNGSTSKTAKVVEDSGAEFARNIKQSAEELTSAYKEMTGALSNGFKGLGKSSGNYIANLDKLNKNLSAINTAYELHLKGASKVEGIVSNYSKGVEGIGKLLDISVEETKKFNQNTREINENIQVLNNIYGRMLGALNNKK